MTFLSSCHSPGVSASSERPSKESCPLAGGLRRRTDGRNLSRSNHEATVLLIERIFGSVSTSTDFIIALRPAEVLSA
jgi:hypothetical protein